MNDFARDELNLSQDAFDASRLATGDLAKFKIAVMDKLAEARAKNHGFLKSQTGICAFLRNLFMSFFMHISASFHAEKLFEQNDVTTEAARDMLKKFST
ncbi:MAG: hypothetical protein LBQ23_03565, partial [Puniceicoccales bacterium]|nr:hypothetical protein [Puniceicoccales bacterium]